MESPTKKTTSSHPKVSVMVTSAISTLNERNGSSLQAIKKYIEANYDADATKLATFIRKFLKAAVEKGDIIQTKGKGASGSFRIKKQEKKKEDTKPLKTVEKKTKPLMASTPKTVLKPKKKAAAKTVEALVQKDVSIDVLDASIEKPPKPVVKAPKKPKSPKPLPAATKGKTSLGSKTKVGVLRIRKGAKPSMLTPIKKPKVVEAKTKKEKKPKAIPKKVEKVQSE
ncbi:histone H1B [Trichonephila clavata]|uniref:Histone H1B n=1 Tax=Trichonephila clavata TaxID=2740835 RepID=A0A8X6IT27_TRICU|nr:histone H1B [Trichonephila clavata]